MGAGFLLSLLGFLVCAGAFVSYPTFFVRIPMTRDLPWASWLLFALGLGLVVVGIRRSFTPSGSRSVKIASTAFAGLSVAVLGFFLFMTEVSSRWLPVSANAPKVGAEAPDFTLPDARGGIFRLADRLGAGRWVLLIFYRGHW